MQGVTSLVDLGNKQYTDIHGVQGVSHL